MNGDANRDPANTAGEPAPARGAKPRLAAFGFLAAFALSTLTLIYTGLLVRAPGSAEPEAERRTAPAERSAPSEQAGSSGFEPEPAAAAPESAASTAASSRGERAAAESKPEPEPDERAAAEPEPEPASRPNPEAGANR